MAGSRDSNAMPKAQNLPPVRAASPGPTHPTGVQARARRLALPGKRCQSVRAGILREIQLDARHPVEPAGS